MGCGRSKCKACKNATKPLNCRRRSILYETACKECIKNDIEGAVYVGESARSGAERMGEHVDDAESGKKDSHMFKHWSTQHGGRRPASPSKLFLSSHLHWKGRLLRLSGFSTQGLTESSTQRACTTGAPSPGLWPRTRWRRPHLEIQKTWMMRPDLNKNQSFQPCPRNQQD